MPVDAFVIVFQTVLTICVHILLSVVSQKGKWGVEMLVTLMEQQFV